MSKSVKKALGVLSGLTLLGLNVAVGLFFALWQTADGAAINRMERASRVDPAHMLPNANLMWAAAHASLLMVLLADVLVTALVVVLVTSHRRSRPTVDESSREFALKH